MPLAFKVTLSEPSAAVVTQVFLSAVERHGAAPHLVTDQGSQFTATMFTEAVTAVGCKQRLGAVGQVGSVAIVERLWRTLKERLRVRVHAPLTLADCERRVHLTLVHYAHCRPHRALGGATPAEVFFGVRPAHESAVHPPRGRRGEAAGVVPFEVVYLDGDRRLPFLLDRAA